MLTNERLIHEDGLCQQALIANIISDYSISHKTFRCLTEINNNSHYIEITFTEDYPFTVPKFSISSHNLPAVQQQCTTRDLGLYHNTWAPSLSVISYVSLIKRRYTPIINHDVEISL